MKYDRLPAVRLLARHRGLSHPYLCHFGRARLEIFEDVFCPTLSNASKLLLDVLEFAPGERVLDAFSGSGAFGINAALAGSRAVLVDISEAANRCAQRNIVLNGVDQLVEIRAGSALKCLASLGCFDLVVANPPLLSGVPADELTASLFSEGFSAILGFLEALPRYLNRGGVAYLVTSDVLLRCGYDVDALCAKHGLVARLVRTADVGYEVYSVHQLRRR